MFDEFLSARLSSIKKEGLYRTLRAISSTPGPKIEIDGKEYANFSSNNYLNLAGNEEINKAASKIIKKYGFAGTSSRLVGGNLDIHEKLENKLAGFKSKEKALLFPSGYQTNVGVISALAAKDASTCIIMDKLNHASLWDGAKLSGSRIFVYEHCDMDSLEKVLQRAQSYKFKLVITESVFSMDGDFTPLKEFAQLCIKYGAVSMLDEAHSTGVFGKEGRGLAEAFGVHNKIDIIIGTLSKAFAMQGGFVCGTQKLIDYIINKSRAFIYSTAVSPAVCAAALKSLELVKRSDYQRNFLHEISKILKTKLEENGFDTSNTKSQIIPVITGTIENTKAASEKFWENGIYAPAIRPPTVPEGYARLRFSLTSGHTLDDIKKITELL